MSSINTNGWISRDTYKLPNLQLTNTLSVAEDVVFEGLNLSIFSDTFIDGTLSLYSEVYLSAELSVAGEAKFGSNLSVAGEAKFGSNLSVAGISTIPIISVSTLDIYGITTIHDQLNLTGTISANALSIGSNAVIEGGLEVATQLNIFAPTLLEGDLTMNGNRTITINDNVITSDSYDSLTIASNNNALNLLTNGIEGTGLTLSSANDIITLRPNIDAGLFEINANFTAVEITSTDYVKITGSTVQIANDLLVNGGLSVAGNFSLNNANINHISVNSLDISNNLTLAGTLSLGGDVFVDTITLSIFGDVYMDAILSVDSEVYLSNELSVAGEAKFGANLSVAGTTTLNNVVITGSVTVPEPTLPGDLVTKQYVDDRSAGLDPKESVRLVSSSNIVGTVNNVALTLTVGYAPLTIDGSDVVLNNRVLLKGQADQTENGIYKVTSLTGSQVVLTRTTDFNNNPVGEISPGSFFFCEEGGAYKNTGWVVNVLLDLSGNKVDPSGGIVFGQTRILFSQFTGTGSLIGGTGINIAGSTISIKYDNLTIGINGSSQIEVKDGGITLPKLELATSGLNNSLNVSNLALTYSVISPNTPTLSNNQAALCISQDGVSGSNFLAVVYKDGSGNNYTTNLAFLS